LREALVPLLPLHPFRPFDQGFQRVDRFGKDGIGVGLLVQREVNLPARCFPWEHHLVPIDLLATLNNWVYEARHPLAPWPSFVLAILDDGRVPLL
jgi:hypothetical protein